VHRMLASRSRVQFSRIAANRLTGRFLPKLVVFYSIQGVAWLVAGVLAVPQAAAQQPSVALAELREVPLQQRNLLLQRLQADPAVTLLDVARAMRGGDPVQKNLFLGVAQSKLDRDPQAGRPVLENIVKNRELDPAVRFWAFDVLTRGDEKSRNAMLQTMLDDPALELRYEAVKLGQSEIKQLKDSGAEPAQLKQAYQRLLVAARLPAQVQEVAASLKELGEEVDLLKHFGFIADWQVMAPFDNRDKIGFSIEYGPEKAYVASPAAPLPQEFEGKSGNVSWKAVGTTAMDGAVDLNPVYSNEKGAVAYALTDFNAKEAVDCEVRLGCINANKVWVNGKLLMSNEVYHAGSQIDQYVAPVSLVAGRNTVLVKICQNEQTESWAQDWKFQLRFTDASGEAIQPAK
jgi:hypothetical protein